jgi:ABC-2 type transport system ATP-binding protein
LTAPTTIRLEQVSLRYRMAHQRVGSFKEYAVHLVSGALRYRELWALRDVDLAIHGGEVVGIVGRNGAGKSTLLKVIAGIFQPTRGRVAVAGHVSPLLELGTGFDYELTGRENIFLNALLLGHKRSEVRERFDGIVEFAELGEFIDAPIRNYSSGMVARLGFAVATAWDPDILILDEVLAVGDSAFQAKCRVRMERIRDNSATVLMVSHSTKTIADECTRCIWLADGQVMADGPPEVVLPHYDPTVHPVVPAAAGEPG